MRMTLARIWLSEGSVRRIRKFILDCAHFRNLLILFIKRYHELIGEWLISDGILYSLIAERLDKRTLGNVQKMQKLRRILSVVEEDDVLREYLGKIKEQKKIVGNLNVVQGILRQVCRDFKSYLKSLRVWYKDRSKFRGRSRPPKVKKLMNIDKFTVEISSKGLFEIVGNVLILKLRKRKDGSWKTLKIKNPDYVKDLSSVRLVYYLGSGYVDLVGEKYIEELKSKGDAKAGIDLGVENIVTVVSSNEDVKSLVIKGSSIKAFNQWYNKLLARLRSEYDNVKNELEKRYDAKLVERLKILKRRIRRLHVDRKKFMENMAHQLSKALVLFLWETGHDTIYVGRTVVESKNKGVGMDKKNNQIFVQVPFRLLIEKLKYKAKWFGMKVIEVDEAYTSKVSCISEDIVSIQRGKESPKLGTRISRSLFKDLKLNKVFHADVNASFNILKVGMKVRSVFKDLNSKVMVKLCNPVVIRWYEFVDVLLVKKQLPSQLFMGW